MRLNPDCVRDVLLVAEDQTGMYTQFRYPFEDENDPLSQYSEEEVLYHIKQCELSGFFTNVSWFLGGDCMVHDLSPKGHEFISNIRSDNVWNKTKDTAKKVGSFSLDTLAKIAINVVSAIIKDNM